MRLWGQRVLKLPISCQISGYVYLRYSLTMRELGKTFQLRRIPSLSSISPHCSFNASWSILAFVHSSPSVSEGLVQKKP